MANRMFRMIRATSFTLLVAMYPGVEASAGSKIYQSVDSNGAVTFTDVPIMLESQAAPGLQMSSKLRQPKKPERPQAAVCKLQNTSAERRCRRKPD